MFKNNHQKDAPYIYYLFVLCALLLMVSVALTYTSGQKHINRCYDLQVAASERVENSFNKIKERKIELGIAIPKEDINKTGMIGEYYSSLTTTMGDLKSKRTATNPNFAAVFIEMFKQANLKKGDEIAIVLSGSFPTLNISALIASEVYGLKTCIMASLGASSYGANNPDFTFFDMAEYLYKEGLIESKIDYLSYGGSNDDGEEYDVEMKNAIMERVNLSNVTFLKESNFEANIQMRKKLILEKCPDIKLFLNVGGNIVSMGEGEQAAVSYKGLIKPNYLRLSKKEGVKGIGLLDTFLNYGIPVIQILNIKGLAFDYGLEYDPVNIPKVGIGDVYYEVKYNLVIPIIALSLSSGLIVWYGFYKKRLKELI